MNWKDEIIRFQNEAEREYGERKTFRTTVRYLLAFKLFMLSTLLAGLRYPFALLFKPKQKEEGRATGLREVTGENIDAALAGHDRVLLEFGAEWCGPCVMMEPALRRFAENTPEILVGKVDADRDAELLQHYRIRGVPQVLLIEKGKEVKRFVGPLSYAELQEFCMTPES